MIMAMNNCRVLFKVIEKDSTMMKVIQIIKFKKVGYKNCLIS